MEPIAFFIGFVLIGISLFLFRDYVGGALLLLFAGVFIILIAISCNIFSEKASKSPTRYEIVETKTLISPTDTAVVYSDTTYQKTK